MLHFSVFFILALPLLVKCSTTSVCKAKEFRDRFSGGKKFEEEAVPWMQCTNRSFGSFDHEWSISKLLGKKKYYLERDEEECKKYDLEREDDNVCKIYHLRPEEWRKNPENGELLSNWCDRTCRPVPGLRTLINQYIVSKVDTKRLNSFYLVWGGGGICTGLLTSRWRHYYAYSNTNPLCEPRSSTYFHKFLNLFHKFFIEWRMLFGGGGIPRKEKRGS